MYSIGVDIGGSRTKSVLVKNGKIVRERSDNLPSSLGGLLNLVAEVVKDFGSLVRKDKIRGVGISIVGPLDLKRERVLASPNIKYLRGQPIKKLLARKLKYPLRIEHDVHSFLLAEKKIGLAKNLKNVFYLTLGTGIGGAMMVDGKIIKGAHGSSGEVGHTIMEAQMSKSKLQGNPSTFEELAANKFIKKNLGIGSEDAFRRAVQGDKRAKKVFEELGKNLGIGIANIINTFDPEAVILSGGISRAMRYIEPGIKASIREFVISPDARRTKVLLSRLGYYGGALGAALLFEE